MSDEMIGFHAQQVVEKLLKAVLANRNIEYPRTHDIDRLVDLLASDVPLPPGHGAWMNSPLGRLTAL